MAPVQGLLNVPVSGALQYGLGVGSQISSSSTVQLAHKSSSVCKLPGYNCCLLSEERRVQSRFSSKALLRKGGPLLSSGVASLRAELAEDADKGALSKSRVEMARHLQESGDRMVVVNISTKTCGPCKLILPKVIKMSSEYPEVLFLKINGDLDNGTRTLMREWGVRAVPTFRFYSKGELIHSHSGAKEDELRSYFLVHYSNLVSAQ